MCVLTVSRLNYSQRSIVARYYLQNVKGIIVKMNVNEYYMGSTAAIDILARMDIKDNELMPATTLLSC